MSRTAVRHGMVGGLLLLGCGVAPAALPDAQVLLVDMPKVESGTATLQRLQQAAAARTDWDAAQRQQAVELALSEILTIAPDVVAEIARERKADLVVLRAAWPKDAEMPPDITDAVIQTLDTRLADLQLEAP